MVYLIKGLAVALFVSIVVYNIIGMLSNMHDKKVADKTRKLWNENNTYR